MKKTFRLVFALIFFAAICILAVSCTGSTKREDTTGDQETGEVSVIQPSESPVTVEDALRDFAAIAFKSDKSYELKYESVLTINEDTYTFDVSAIGYYGNKGFNADVNIKWSGKKGVGLEIYLRETEVKVGAYSEKGETRDYYKSAAGENYITIPIDEIASGYITYFEPAEWKMVFESYIDQLNSEDAESDGSANALKEILATETEEGASGDRYVKRSFDYTQSLGAIFDLAKENEGKTFGELLGVNADKLTERADALLSEDATVEDVLDAAVAVLANGNIEGESISSLKELCDYAEKKFSYKKMVAALYVYEIIDREKRNQLEDYEGYYGLLKSASALDKNVSKYMPKDVDTDGVKTVASMNFDDLYEIIKEIAGESDKIDFDFTVVDSALENLKNSSVDALNGRFSADFNGGEFKTILDGELDLISDSASDEESGETYKARLHSTFDFISKDERPVLTEI